MHLRYNFLPSIVLLTALLVSGCRNRQAETDTFTQPLYKPAYASGFEILGADKMESVLINITNPWQGADSVTTQLLIVRGDESIPDGFTGQVLHNKASRIVTMSSTQIAMLDAIDATDHIVGVSGIDFITNPDIQARRDSIGDIGYEGNVNYELLMSLAPDLVLLYGVNSANPMENKLNELGIPYMYVGDYLEESPLGKAEWLVAIAELTGNREIGKQTFAEIPRRYNSIKNMVDSADTDAPKVMLNIPYGSSWFMPPANSYLVQLIKDAGGKYVYDQYTGNASKAIDIEEAYLMASQADVWLNTGSANSLDELKRTCPKFVDTDCIKNGRVFNNTLRTNPAGGNDFFESAIMHPDLLLRDLVKILHPNMIEDDFVYFKQLR